MESAHSLGGWLRRMREMRGLSRPALANKVPCAAVTICKIEKDENRPSYLMAKRIGIALELSPEECSTLLKVVRGELDIRDVPLYSRPVLPQSNLHTANLPIPPTELIGRRKEVEWIHSALRNKRLVTLIGPGGIGKTRLALQAATELWRDFADGVQFVDLARISEPTQLLNEIARSLQVRGSGSEPLIKSLQRSMHGKQMLLVLDNFEQIMAAKSDVSKLLRVWPQLKLLITSREALNLYGEQKYRVPNLTLPPCQWPAESGKGKEVGSLLERSNLKPSTLSSLSIADLSSYEGIQLFIERAQAAKHDFELTSENALAVITICHRLGGLPLAIELAAARISHIAPSELLGQLNQQLDMLTDGPSDVPDRQQSLRAMIDWSYRLLNDGEQRLFARLSTFVGGCTFKGVGAVCNAELDLPFDTLKGLYALEDKSLLQQDNDRFTMHETIRQYALERLVDNGELSLLEERRAEFFLELAEVADLPKRGLQGGSQLDQMEVEFDNFRAVLFWAIEHQEIEQAMRLSNALWLFWELEGLLTQGRKWLERVLELEGSSADLLLLRAEVLFGAGTLACHQGDLQAARKLFEESLTIGWTQPNKEIIGWSFYGLGQVAQYDGEHELAKKYYHESVDWFHTIRGERGKRGRAWGYCNLAEVTHIQGDNEKANYYDKKSLKLFRELKDKQGIAIMSSIRAKRRRDVCRYTEAIKLFEDSRNAFRDIRDSLNFTWATHNIAEVQQLQKMYEEAEKYYQESLRMFSLLMDRSGIGWSWHNQAHMAMEQSNDVLAMERFDKSFDSFNIASLNEGFVACLEGCARVWVARGQPKRATRLLGAAEALNVPSHKYKVPIQYQAYKSTFTYVQENLDQSILKKAWDEGKMMNKEQAQLHALGKDNWPAG